MRFLKVFSSVLVASWLKYSLAFVSLTYLYIMLNRRSESLFAEINKLFVSYPTKTFAIACLLITLSCCNWLIEVMKWHLLINRLKPNVWKQSFKESFMAHAVGVFTPNKIGDHLCKLMFHPEIKKLKIVEISITQHLFQLLATIIFGLIGLFSMVNIIAVKNLIDVRLGVIILGILVVGLVFTNFINPKLRQKIRKYQALHSEKNNYIVVLSIVKYLVFSHLFICLLYLLGAEISYTNLLIGTWTMYLLSSVIPTFMATDLIVKSGVAVFVFSAFQVTESIVLLASFLMWGFNFVIPAVLGNFYLLQKETMQKMIQKKKAIRL